MELAGVQELAGDADYDFTMEVGGVVSTVLKNFRIQQKISSELKKLAKEYNRTYKDAIDEFDQWDDDILLDLMRDYVLPRA